MGWKNFNLFNAKWLIRGISNSSPTMNRLNLAKSIINYILYLTKKIIGKRGI